MNAASSTLIKNAVVAVTLALAAVATWAVTDSHAPEIDASSAISQHA